MKWTELAQHRVQSWTKQPTKYNYKVVQILPGLLILVYTQISPRHILTTLYI